MSTRSSVAGARPHSITPRAQASPLAAVIFDLDEHDLVAIEDDVEALDDAWLVSLDDPPASAYAPGLSDDEVDAIVAGLTRELCRPSRGRMR